MAHILLQIDSQNLLLGIRSHLLQALVNHYPSIEEFHGEIYLKASKTTQYTNTRRDYVDNYEFRAILQVLYYYNTICLQFQILNTIFLQFYQLTIISMLDSLQVIPLEGSDMVSLF